MNKLFKTGIVLLLASSFAISLGACGSETVKDTDFDGLTDNIDPDPNNNQYRISLVKETEEGSEESGELTLTMDYRDFITPGYKYNLGLLGSFLVTEGSAYKSVVKNNVYPSNTSRDSLINPLLTQIGGEDVELINISKNKFNEDPYDIVDLVMAHHTFEYENNKYQVFFTFILPYPFRTGWVSNIDVGAAKENGELTEAYKELEGSSHTDWTNHIEHKGFAVSATRALKEIKAYENKHLKKDATPIMYVTGHSRGGAVSNLIGKDYIDNNKQVRAYCFNPPNTTLESDEVARKESYNSSIYNIINNGDLVSYVPPFGFKLYGKDYRYDIDKDIYEAFMKKEYEGNSPESVKEVTDLLDKVVTKGGLISRNNFYEFRDPDEDFEEKWEGTKEEMDKFKAKLDNGNFIPNNSYARKCFDYSDVKGEDDDCYIEYKTRPALLKALLIDLLGNNDTKYLLSYLELFDRLLSEMLSVYMDSDFSVLRVVNGHEQPIACVMAAQYK